MPSNYLRKHKTLKKSSHEIKLNLRKVRHTLTLCDDDLLGPGLGINKLNPLKGTPKAHNDK